MIASSATARTDRETTIASRAWAGPAWTPRAVALSPPSTTSQAHATITSASPTPDARSAAGTGIIRSGAYGLLITTNVGATKHHGATMGACLCGRRRRSHAQTGRHILGRMASARRGRERASAANILLPSSAVPPVVSALTSWTRPAFSSLLCYSHAAAAAYSGLRAVVAAAAYSSLRTDSQNTDINPSLTGCVLLTDFISVFFGCSGAVSASRSTCRCSVALAQALLLALQEAERYKGGMATADTIVEATRGAVGERRGGVRGEGERARGRTG